MFPSTLSFRAGLFSLLCGLIVAPAAAQDPPALRLDGVIGSGMRSSVAEAWGTFDFSITNQSDGDRQARLLFFYEGRPDTPLDRVQYGRDVWVPARATLSSWLLTGPVPAEKRELLRSIQMLLYDRTDGDDKQIKPKSEERIRSREVLYRKREAYTTLYLDDEALEGLVYGELPKPTSPRGEIIQLARTLRGAVGLSSLTPVVRSGPLPVTPEAFDGIDHLVLASNRIAEDPIGLRAVRQWLVGGGTVWVMLDRVDADLIGPLLGDGIDFQVVDRLSLTTLRIADRKGRETATEHERPVEFVRVLLPPDEEPRYTLDGWPVWFMRPVGRGRITHRTRTERHP